MRLSQEHLDAIAARHRARESQIPARPMIQNRLWSRNPSWNSDIEWLKPELENQDVHILGSGASLYGIDWSKFDNQKTIVINNTIKWYNKPTVHVFLDMPVLLFGGLGECPIITKTGNTIPNHSHPVYHITLGNRLTNDPIRTGFYSHYSTSHVAISLSIWANAKRIFLWGLEQMFYEHRDFVAMEEFAIRSDWYIKHDFEAQSKRIQNAGGNFGHFYSDAMPHPRDRMAKSYVQAGNLMDAFKGKANIHVMTPIHNTPFSFLHPDTLLEDK